MNKYQLVYKCLCCRCYMKKEGNLPPLVCPQCGEKLWTVVPDGTPVVYRDKCVEVSAKRTILGWKEEKEN